MNKTLIEIRLKSTEEKINEINLNIFKEPIIKRYVSSIKNSVNKIRNNINNYDKVMEKIVS